MSPRFSHLIFVRSLCLAVSVAFIAASCTEDNPVAPPAPPADVNTYFESLPTWGDFSPSLADADVSLGDPTESEEPVGGQPHNCTTTPYSMTRTPDRIVTLNPDVEILWVGSLLQGRGHLSGIGSLAELPIRQRNPVTLSIDLLTADNTREVANPSVGSVTSAIGDLIQAAQNLGHTAGSNIFFTNVTAHSLTQAALSMGLSASYMGASIKASLSSNISTETRTITAYFVQRMFSVSMALPQTPQSVFSDAFTNAVLQEQVDLDRIGPENPPVYVSSVAYGRILMFSFTSTATLAEINATISALYNSGEFGGELSAELRVVLDNAEIQVVTVGGDAESALALIRSNDLGQYFTTDAPLTTARPISYTVRNLGDNSIATVSETTTYNLKQCVPAALPVTGARYRLKFTKFTAIDLPDIDAWPEWWDIELLYFINIETLDGVDRVQNELGSFRRLRENETYVLPANEREFSIHFDSSDWLRIWGTVYDFDDFSRRDELNFYREYKYPSRAVVAGESYVDATDSAGNKVRLFYTLVKTGDLN